MRLSRLIFALLLTLTFTGAPVLRAFAVAPQGPEAASSHSAHCAQAEHAAAQASLPGDVGHPHGSAHPSCDGMCCTTCTFGAAAVVLPAMATALVARAIRTPTEPRLSSFSPVSLRDRPPRVLSL